MLRPTLLVLALTTFATPCMAQGSSPTTGLVPSLGAGFLFLIAPENSPVVLAAFWTLWVLSLPLRHRFFHRRVGWAGLGIVAYVLLATLFLPGARIWFEYSLLYLGLGMVVAWVTEGRRCPRCRMGYLRVHARVLREATPGVAGRGGSTVTCPLCAFHHLTPQVLPPRSGKPLPRPAVPLPGPTLGGPRSGGAGAGRSY